MAQKSNLIGLARTALANGGKIFVTPVAEMYTISSGVKES